MYNNEIDEEFYRIVTTYDRGTLIQLFEDRFTTKEKEKWIKVFHGE